MQFVSDQAEEEGEDDYEDDEEGEDGELDARMDAFIETELDDRKRKYSHPSRMLNEHAIRDDDEYLSHLSRRFPAEESQPSRNATPSWPGSSVRLPASPAARPVPAHQRPAQHQGPVGQASRASSNSALMSVFGSDLDDLGPSRTSSASRASSAQRSPVAQPTPTRHAGPATARRQGQPMTVQDAAAILRSEKPRSAPGLQPPIQAQRRPASGAVSPSPAPKLALPGGLYDGVPKPAAVPPPAAYRIKKADSGVVKNSGPKSKAAKAAGSSSAHAAASQQSSPSPSVSKALQFGAGVAPRRSPAGAPVKPGERSRKVASQQGQSSKAIAKGLAPRAPPKLALPGMLGRDVAKAPSQPSSKASSRAASVPASLHLVPLGSPRCEAAPLPDASECMALGDRLPGQVSSRDSDPPLRAPVPVPEGRIRSEGARLDVTPASATQPAPAAQDAAPEPTPAAAPDPKRVSWDATIAAAQDAAPEPAPAAAPHPKRVSWGVSWGAIIAAAQHAAPEPAPAAAAHPKRVSWDATITVAQDAVPEPAPAAAPHPKRVSWDATMAAGRVSKDNPGDESKGREQTDGGSGCMVRPGTGVAAGLGVPSSSFMKPPGPVELDRWGDRREQAKLRWQWAAEEACAVALPAARAQASLARSMEPSGYRRVPKGPVTLVPMDDLLGGVGRAQRRARTSSPPSPRSIRTHATQQERVAGERARQEQARIQAASKGQRQGLLAARRACSEL